MADGFIVRKGGVTEEVLRTTAPTINFVSKTDSEIVVTFTNNDAAEAEIYYGLTSPLTDTVTLATTVTSSNITFSGLNDDTTFTISAYALVTDPTSKKIKSEIVTTNITTDVAFSPANLSPQLWLDASDATTITASSGDVSQWNNKGSLGNFTQATGARQPKTGVTTLNGLNVIDFDQDVLDAANTNEWKILHDGTVYEMFAVVKIGTVSDPNTFYYIMGTTDGTTNVGFNILYLDRASNSENNKIAHIVRRGVGGSTAVENVTANDYFTPNTFAILHIVGDFNNATAANKSEIRTNNASPIKNNSLTNAVSTANPTNAFQIGDGGGGTGSLVGSYAEIIVTTAANVTSGNRTDIIDYLADKWGITL